MLDAKGTNPNEYGGGTIRIREVSSLSVSSSSFIDHYRARDGAGITLVYSNSPTQQIILNRRFIKCVSGLVSADGGDVAVWNNELSLGLSRCLFSFCTSTSADSALYILLPSTPNGTALRLCFFHANYASQKGRDIMFYLAAQLPILNPFSVPSL